MKEKRGGRNEGEGTREKGGKVSGKEERERERDEGRKGMSIRKGGGREI